MTLATLPPDPVLANHHTQEPADWRLRGSTRDMTTRLWHAGGDFGAHTRFGMGWGPLEVIRRARTEAPDLDDPYTRVIEIRLAGVPRVHVTATGEREIHVTYLDGTPAPEPPPAPAEASSGAEDGSRAPAVPASPPPPPVPGHVSVPADVYERLTALSLEVQDELTPARREKRYVPRASIAAVDEIHRLLTVTAVTVLSDTGTTSSSSTTTTTTT